LKIFRDNSIVEGGTGTIGKKNENTNNG
jgi:hypothetical protein